MIFQTKPTPRGEPFTAEEVEEMMGAAVDPEKQAVLCENHVLLMAVDDRTYGRFL